MAVGDPVLLLTAAEESIQGGRSRVVLFGQRIWVVKVLFPVP